MLADPSKFTAKKIDITVDSLVNKMDINTMNIQSDQDGLFVFFSKDFNGADLHTIMVKLDPNDQGSWNLVEIK